MGGNVTKKPVLGLGWWREKPGGCGRALREEWLAEAGRRPVAAGGECGWGARDQMKDRRDKRQRGGFPLA
jgi:hypothetical protein